MPPFVLQQDCDNPHHLVMQLGDAFEVKMTQSELTSSFSMTGQPR
jgi:hypothetical protein